MEIITTGIGAAFSRQRSSFAKKKTIILFHVTCADDIRLIIYRVSSIQTLYIQVGPKKRATDS